MLETHWSYGFNPWTGKIPGVGNGNPLQYSCLENPMDRGVLWATVHGVAKGSDKTERLSVHVHARTRMHTHTHKYIYGSDLGHLSFKCWWNFLFKRTKDYWSESCSIMSYCLWPHRIYIQSMEFSSQNTGVGSLPLLQGIFPTQGWNPGLPHCRQFLYQLSPKGMPRILEWVAYPFSSGSSQPRNWTRVSCTAGDSLPTELPGKSPKDY